MNTELKERLTNLEERLKERGVESVRFHVDKTDDINTEQVAIEAAEFIEAVLDGKTKPFFGLGDSSNPATISYFAEQRRKYEEVHGPI